MDHVKEDVFSALANCDAAVCVDLFCGSGSLGLEAVSRGAKWVDFVDGSQSALNVTAKNVEKLKCHENVRLHRYICNKFVSKASRQYDYIFMDPPYEKNLVNKTLDLIFASNMLAVGGYIVVEHSKYEKLSEKYIAMLEYTRDFRNTNVCILAANKEITTKEENYEDL